MADNTTLNAGSGGDTIASDDIAGVKHQRVKIEYGTDGSATDVSDTNPLPVDDAGGSLTVDNAALSVVGGGVEATALRVTLASDSTGVVSVDDNGGSLTVDGTVAVTNASLTTIAGAVSGTEMQVDVLTSALPSGAATAAKQPALGTAGAASADVISVQGIASMTPIQVADNGGSLTVDGTVTANLAAGTNNIGDVDVLSVPAPLSTSGGGTEATALRVTLASDSTGVVSIDDNGGSLTVDGTVTANLSATDNAVLDAIQEAVEIIDNAISGSEMQVDVVAALPAGTNNIGDVDVLTVPAVAGEAASTKNSSSSDGATALTSTVQAIKASAGSLKGYYIYNPNATAQFVQFYNTASGSVTVGTTTPLFMITIPATSAANLWMQPGGVAFGTAMSWAATSTAGGNGAPTTALDAVCWYT